MIRKEEEEEAEAEEEEEEEDMGGPAGTPAITIQGLLDAKDARKESNDPKSDGNLRIIHAPSVAHYLFVHGLKALCS